VSRFGFILLFSISCLAFESSNTILVGYDQPIKTRLMTFEDRIAGIIESKENFHILFNGHPAYYLFPKNEGQTAIRQSLQTLKDGRKAIAVEFDGMTAKISKLTFSKLE
jgi:hypothetical protein